MKSFTSTVALALVSAGILAVAGSAHAEETYAGAALGARTHFGLDCNGIDRCDRSPNTSGKVYLGRTYNDIFGAELLAYRLGNARGSIDGSNGRQDGRVKAEGLGAVGVARLQLDAWTLKGRLGAAYQRGSASFADGSSDSKNGIVPVIGVGAAYRLNKAWSLTADLDHFDGRFGSREKAGVQMLSVGAAFNF